MNISIVDSEEAKHSLRDEWNALLRASASETVFLTWEWSCAWWKAYGQDKRLWIIKLEDGGELHGLVPLYLSTFTRMGLPYVGAYFIGDGSSDSDYLDIIARRGREAEVATALTRYFADTSGKWGALFLNEVPQGSPSIWRLQQCLARRGWHWAQTSVPCAYVTLPSSWESYLASLKPRMRTKIRSIARDLEKRFTVRVDLCERVEDLDDRLERLFDTHALRWREKSQQGVFTTDAKRRFYRELSELFLANGWLRFYSLAVDDRYVAHQYCFEYQRTVSLLQEGFDPVWDEHGVGNALRAYVLRDCIERGVRVYDFLAGVSQHKLSWGAQVKDNFRVSTAPSTLRSALLFQLPRALERTKAAAKAVLPERVVQWALGR